MKMMIAVMTLMVLLVCPPAFAKDKGNPHQHDSTTLGDASKRIAGEVIDAVTDELVGDDGSSHGKHKHKHKKGQHPPGWDKGKKKGWHKDEATPQRDSLLRNAIRGIFRTNKDQAD